MRMDVISEILKEPAEDTATANRYLINNQLYPRGPVHPIIGALFLYLNQIKCSMMFTQHMWADDKIQTAYPLPIFLTPSAMTEPMRRLYTLGRRLKRYQETRAKIALHAFKAQRHRATFTQLHQGSVEYIRHAATVERLANQPQIIMKPSKKIPNVFVPAIK